jgi:hypothetical protein
LEPVVYAKKAENVLTFNCSVFIKITKAMINHRTALIALLMLVPLRSQSDQTAMARMSCLSPKFEDGYSQSGKYGLSFQGWGSGNNGELVRVSGGQFSHSSNVKLNDYTLGKTYIGNIVVNVPTDDWDQNGMPDFYESSRSTDAVTAGQYTITPLGYGSILATWRRSAGSTSGTCILRLMTGQNTTVEVFTHTFDLLEYRGEISYLTGRTNVNGTINIAQTGAEYNVFQGPVTFVKTSPNNYIYVTLRAGAWTDAYSQTFSFTSGNFTRAPLLSNFYVGELAFADGDPSTPERDYAFWRLVIADFNDFDHDGVPDFGDDTPLPHQPVLALSAESGYLLLNIRGDVGHVHHVLEATSPSALSWTINSSFVITNVPQTIVLPYPDEVSKFWRVMAE